MRTIKEYINESGFPIELDKSVKGPEKRKVQAAIYNQLEKTGTTGHYYHDESWEGVTQVKKDIEDAFKTIKNPQHEYEVSIAPINGGYRKSSDGMSQWKEYKVEIYVKGAENPFIVGTLNCHAAGTVKDPFDAYDMSCVITC